MSTTNRLEKIDAVTVGQIRKRYLNTLESEIGVLNGLIRQGYFNLPKAELYLKEAIAKTLTSLQNIEAMASAEITFSSEQP